MINNGFIYPLVDSIVTLLHYCNLVELFKYISRIATNFECHRCGRNATKEELISAANIAIDIYQLFKFGLLLFFWLCEYSNITSKVIIYYLLANNLFTYFYYHVWGGRYKQRIDRDTLNRKFMNFLLAVSYYLLCYAYMYQFHYSAMLSWPDNVIDFANSLYLSVSTAFTLTYDGFQPLTKEVRLVFMSEIINTFMFLTIIMSNSIPNHTNGEKENEPQK